MGRRAGYEESDAILKEYKLHRKNDRFYIYITVIFKLDSHWQFKKNIYNVQSVRVHARTTYLYFKFKMCLILSCCKNVWTS